MAFKAAVASGLALAGAETVKLTYTDCGSSSTHGKITGLTPDTIPVPGKSQVIATGTLDADQTAGAHFTFKAKKGLIPFVSGSGNICEDTTINLPLGAGSFTVKGIDCPAKAGDLSVEVDLDIASALFADGENSLLTIHLDANADDTGDQMICVDIDASLASEGADWEAFKAKYGKVFNGADHEEEHRQVYLANMKWAKDNSDDKVQFGENQFSDLTQAQYKLAAGLGYKPSALKQLPHLGVHEYNGEELASTIDWTTRGAVTPVKDQGQCGSCWAFSTTGGMEGAWQIASGSLTSMSEQQLVDCSTQNSGCNGGSMELAFNFAGTVNVATESSYPYTARDGTCKTSYSTAIPRGGVTGYKSVSQSTSALKSALNTGPVSVAIEADQMAFQMYSGGILSSGCGTNLDHGVLAVGYGDGYFKVKNSWGSSWGSNGYLQISDQGNVCGIHSDASYPTVSASVAV